MDLILTQDMITKLEEILRTELLEHGVDHAFVVDSSGNLITEGGIFPPEDIMPLAALLSANFAATERIAKLIGEKDFTLLFHKGSRFNIHFGRINQDFILVTLFNNEISLGLVRLGSIKAIEQMLPVLQAA
jgi:predicted regulator of Ras-like GTPase activity (Roadblock/LC7/MglB family)